jgi:hypothetical protein
MVLDFRKKIFLSFPGYFRLSIWLEQYVDEELYVALME